MALYSLTALILGFVGDFIFGDPNTSLHPIRLIGRLIEGTENILRKIFPPTEKGLRWAGALLAFTVCLISTGTAALILFMAYRINIALGVLTEAVICFFMLSAKSLKRESMKVYDRLKAGDIQGARQAVSMIVGRDTAALDEGGVVRAAVETVAENLSDGVIAPLFYMIIGGGALGVFYKAVNTMDSMVGYKNDKYIYFGSFAAHLDDIINLIPSRLSALIMLKGAYLLRLDYKNAFRIYLRDRLKHPSPNSAQTEAVCAGALRIRLAGDSFYFGRLCRKPYIGDAIEEITADKIKQANRLMYASAIWAAVIFVILKLILIWRVWL